MKHLPYSIPLPRRAGTYEYLNITRLGTLKIESPPMGTTIEKDTTGAPGTFAAIGAYPADWLDGETIKITKGTGMVTIDCYKANELYTSTDVASGGASGLMAAADKTKLDGIATGATANDTDANLKARANHTGTQAISTVTGLTTALSNKVETSLLGAVSGVATLDGAGKVPTSQLPAMGTGDMLKSTYDTDNDGVVDSAAAAPWAGITGKPSTFTPATHTHAQSDITNLVTDLAGKASTTHTHAQSDVTGLVTALAGKVDTSLLGAVSGVATLDGAGKVPSAQLPPMGGTGDMLQSVYDTNNNGVVDAAESVAWTGVTGKPSTFTPSTHTHPQSDITNLVTDLAAKIPSTEKGAASGVATLDGTGKVPASQLPSMGTGDMTKAVYDTDNDGVVDSAAAAPWSGITGKPSTFTPSTHTHAQSDITNLVTDLAAKIPATEKAAANGVATLDATGKIPSAQMPSSMGTGDMTKSVYDTDNDGVVDSAAAVPWTGVTGKPSTFTPATHTHPQSDITNLVTDLAAKIPSSEKGANNGVATLDSGGKVPTAQLPAMGGLSSRATATLTTGSLADGASTSTTITLGKTARILSVQLDRAARVAFYATTAIRDADVGRAVMTDPPNGTYIEVVSTAAATYYMSGNASGLVSNMEGSPTTSIAVNVYNLSGSSSTVTVTVVYVQLEA